MTNFKKNFIWNIIGTGINSFSSLFLMIMVTRINGIEEAGIYSIAFSTACILYIIGTYAGRVFQVTDTNKEITDKDYLLNRYLSCIVMIISTIVFLIFRRYDVYKATVFIILAIYKALEALSDCIYGIFQKNDVLYKVGISYFVKSILMLITFLIADKISNNLIIASGSIVIVWLMVLIVYDLPNLKKYINKNDKYILKNALAIFKSGFFVFIMAFLGIYIVNAQKYAIDNYLDESTQTIFGIIVMPAMAVTLFGQFLLHPYLSKLVELTEKNKNNEINKIIRKIIIYIIAFGIFSTVIGYLIGTQVLSFIYNIDLTEYKTLLAIILIASTLYNCGVVYSNLLTTFRKINIQFGMYLIISTLALISSNLLTKSSEIKGATISYFITMLVYCIVHAVIEKIAIYKRMKKEPEYEKN